MFKKTLIAGIALIAGVTEVQAQRWRPGAWEPIGTQTVSGALDRDEIKVRGDERFRQVRVCATNRPLALLGGYIRFENRGQQPLGRFGSLRPGRCTPTITLKGAGVGMRRNIDMISLVYSKPPRGMNPEVRVDAR